MVAATSSVLASCSTNCSWVVVHFVPTQRPNLLDQITTHEPRPPRQCDDTIPKELERICLKMLSKRATERYSTAKDVAEDLRHFLKQNPGDAIFFAGCRSAEP